LGPLFARIAEAFGQPLMPWQRQVADVGLELLEDGRPAYREVIISVPRQNGKTTLILAWEVDRALMWGRRQRIIYSAQTGRDAREKLLEDQVPIIHGDPEGSGPFSPAIRKVDKTNGGEAIVFKGGSRISVVASSESAGHGKTIGLGVVDEAFDDVDNRREQALSPAMRTVRDAQLIVASTMGTDASIYLNRKVETGRLIAEQDRDDARVCYFEWSAPDDADIADPAVWAACTPALGYTVDLDTIRAEYESNLATPGEFKRFGLNQRTASDERIIPLAAWNGVCSPDVIPDGRAVFAIDSNPERSWSSIALADTEGRVELIENDRGTGWLVARSQQLAQKWGTSVAVDPNGPAGSLIPDLKTGGVRVIEVGGREFTKACGQFYDAVLGRQVHVRVDGRLDGAVAAAKKKPAGDAWVWARKGLSDISPLVAATIALYAAKTAPNVELVAAWA
jgi:Terminase large subunit, T4likevirus-type, N-terminal